MSGIVEVVLMGLLGAGCVGALEGLLRLAAGRPDGEGWLAVGLGALVAVVGVMMVVGR